MEVDPDTGQVTVHRLVTAHDVGTIINPLDHQGQIDGAGDARRVGENVAEVCQAEVRQAKRMVRDARAGEVERAEAGTPREHCSVGVYGPHELERLLDLHGRPQPGSGRQATTAHASGGMWTFTSSEPTS